MRPALHDILYFLVVSVALRFFVMSWIETAVREWVWKHLLTTERDLITYLHYKHHFMRNGHRPRKPLDCQDDHCKLIKG